MLETFEQMAAVYIASYNHRSSIVTVPRCTRRREAFMDRILPAKRRERDAPVYEFKRSMPPKGGANGKFVATARRLSKRNPES